MGTTCEVVDQTTETQRVGVGRSRRDLFRAFGLIGASALAAARPRAAKASPPDVSSDVDPNSLIYKLVQRITFGYSDAEFAAASALGYSAYLEQQLNPSSITEDPALGAALAALLQYNKTPAELYAQFNTSASAIVFDMIEARVRRAVSSKRQLQERMVEFWTDHLNIDINNDEDQWLKVLDDRNVIRPNALTTFPALINASARSPAMLYYLNNDISTKNAPNENYGRELLELHTMSPASGYTQADVLAVARCFTGWTRWSGSDATNPGAFRYRSSYHDTGSKTLSPIFDIDGGFDSPVVIPANQPDMADGQRILDIVSRHPATASFIAGKLCRRFLGESVPSAIISQVAQTYLTSNGDIKSMLRAMLAANIVADAEPRFKRPLHLIVSAMRSLPTTISASSGLRMQLSRCGHMPFYWGPPDGYPDTTAYWCGSELPRWSYGATVATNGVTGVAFNLTSSGGLFFGLPIAGGASAATSAAAHINKINQSMFGGEMDPYDKARLQTYLQTAMGATGSISTTMQRDVVGLAIGCPSFQWY